MKAEDIKVGDKIKLLGTVVKTVDVSAAMPRIPRGEVLVELSGGEKVWLDHTLKVLLYDDIIRDKPLKPFLEDISKRLDEIYKLLAEKKL